jgi:beta-lactamase superfamily II metal-dependent hydrolase
MVSQSSLHYFEFMKKVLTAALHGLAVLLILVVTPAAKRPPALVPPPVDSDEMVAHFINVGQGAATLLEFPCGAVLIDAGAQDAFFEHELIAYLDRFFATHQHLNRTIDLVIVTHAHQDHNIALDNVVQNFTVKRYVDNGMITGSGRRNQKWLQRNAGNLDIEYKSWTFEQIASGGNKNGLTNAVIDPIDCGNVDPRISLFSARYGSKPTGWSNTTFKNGNNQSLVVKVVFGNSSFIFTGDLEEKGIESLVRYYTGTNNLDADVLHAGHHGSHNATTQDLLSAVTPSHAVISCGAWNYGLGPGDNKNFNTYNYGHPRISTLDLLATACTGDRSQSVTVKAATGAKKFRNVSIRKRIYCTAWDRNIRITASKEGNYRVTVMN